mmetsp:Transcript_32689/g.61461  ORF Transcript_32689/g.61461 Transcript_32689/m.61461 type:complete len:491 (+) Transcript_32689:537-2009(+)
MLNHSYGLLRDISLPRSQTWPKPALDYPSVTSSHGFENKSFEHATNLLEATRIRKRLVEGVWIVAADVKPRQFPRQRCAPPPPPPNNGDVSVRLVELRNSSLLVGNAAMRLEARCCVDDWACPEPMIVELPFEQPCAQASEGESPAWMPGGESEPEAANRAEEQVLGDAATNPDTDEAIDLLALDQEGVKRWMLCAALDARQVAASSSPSAGVLDLVLIAEAVEHGPGQQTSEPWQYSQWIGSVSMESRDWLAALAHTHSDASARSDASTDMDLEVSSLEEDRPNGVTKLVYPADQLIVLQRAANSTIPSLVDCAFVELLQDCLFLKRDDNAADCHKDQDAFEIEAEHAEKEISGCRVKFKGHCCRGMLLATSDSAQLRLQSTTDSQMSTLLRTLEETMMPCGVCIQHFTSSILDLCQEATHALSVETAGALDMLSKRGDTSTSMPDKSENTSPSNVRDQQCEALTLQLRSDEACMQLFCQQYKKSNGDA